MSIRLELGNFTPVPDELVNKFGFFTAGLYGKVWRYEQMQDGICRAAIETIAGEMGVSYETVLIHIKKLCEPDPGEKHGYLEDLTPKIRNRPHVYRTTGKLKMVLRVESNQVSEIPIPKHDQVSENLIAHSRNFRDESDSLNTQADKADEKGADAPPYPSGKPPEGHKESTISLLSHPAIQAFKKVIHRYPRMAIREDVIRTFGDDPDMELLWDCYTLIVAKTANEFNWLHLRDKYLTRLGNGVYPQELEWLKLQNNPYRVQP